MLHFFSRQSLQKTIALFCLFIGLGLFSLLPKQSQNLLRGHFSQAANLNAQVGIDFNNNGTGGSFNISTEYRIYHNTGNILPQDQGSLNININGFLWLNPNLSTRFMIGVGLPLLSPHTISDLALATQSLYFYNGEFALRFNLVKTNDVVVSFGALMTWNEGHSGHVLLFNEDAQNIYLQTALGVEFELGLALGLEHLLYFRLKAPILSYNSIANQDLEMGFYPRQGSAEVAFLFHKGPSFALSKAARNFYFGPFYRFDIQVLDVETPHYIISHTIGLTYYVKPPF